MSLHDMYFSSKNKNYIFEIIKDIVFKETGEDINQNNEYIDLYRFKYSLIFERNNFDNLIDLNKSLIDEIAPIFINDINSKYSIENKPNKIEKIDNKIDNKIDKINDEKQIWKEYYINSSNRNKNSLNNYNYNLDLPKNINYFILKEISIPSENNILFKNLIICVKIDENNIYCLFKKKIESDNINLNIYEPLSELKIKNKLNINIQILTNNLSVIKEKDDKIKLDKLKNFEIKNNKYLCFKIKEKHNINNKNTILLYENDKIKKTLTVDSKIENNLLFKNKEIEFDNNKDYYILDYNLQNNIILKII